MNTMSLNVEIKEENKENGKLKDDFKLNVEVNFIKTLLDFVKSGEDITISKLFFSEQIVEVEEDVEVIDSDTKEKKILKEKIKKNCYNCTGLIKIHKYVEAIPNRPRTELKPKMIKDKKITSIKRR